MKPRRLPNGRLLIPVRLEGPDGTVGDGMREIDETDPEWDEWVAELEPEPVRFVRPSFPPRFELEDEDGGRLGPFDRDDLIEEHDGPVVFYEDGSLPMRLGVLRQEGQMLHLFPGGSLKIVPTRDPA